MNLFILTVTMVMKVIEKSSKICPKVLKFPKISLHI